MKSPVGQVKQVDALLQVWQLLSQASQALVLVSGNVISGHGLTHTGMCMKSPVGQVAQVVALVHV